MSHLLLLIEVEEMETQTPELLMGFPHAPLEGPQGRSVFCPWCHWEVLVLQDLRKKKHP